MEFKQFYKILKEKSNKIKIEITEEQAKKFYEYMNLLLEWNEKMNLTAIKETNDIILKHFVDSITISKYIKDKESLIDVGTGAGFPGIPLNIINDKLNYTLIDSLNKRILFLEEVIQKEKLKNIVAIHTRVEEFAKNEKYREKYDIATSRAVAPLNILLEYLLPLVKIGGICICMKGSNIEEEMDNSREALSKLGGKVERVDKINLPDTDIIRNIIIVKKVRQTPIKYPRKPGIPNKEPL